MRQRTSVQWIARVALACGLALSVSGCESLDNLNPFQEKEKKLTGERHPVFPQGVPGVDYSATPSQPTNANTPLDVPSAPPPQGGQQR